MSAVAAPFGLKPSYHPSGIVRPDKASIASGYASNIFQGSPVIYVSTGGITLAASAGSAVGAFQGVEYNSPSAGGRRVVSNTWPASTVATNIVAYITSDPHIVYEIQANATLTSNIAIGHTYNWSTNATANGDVNSGISSVSLDVASVATPNAGLIVIGLAEYVDNDWADPFPIVLVKIAKPQFGAFIASLY